jgi:putative two-component system response regulator
MKVEFLACVQEIALYRHEKWDGGGYPCGLSGADIPVSARLMAVADVYDALISKRVYKKDFSHDQAVTLILEGRGRHFDPDVVDAFVAIDEKIKAVADRYRD